MEVLKVSKIKRLQHYFPELPDTTCSDVLDSTNWDVEEAVTFLGGKPTLNLSADQELTDWPKLSDTTKVQDKSLGSGRRVSGSSTPDKPVLNRQRSLGSSPSPRSSPFDRQQYAKKNDDPPSLARRPNPTPTTTSSLSPNGREAPTEMVLVEPTLQHFPPKANHEYLEQALKAELLIPELRKVFLLATTQPGKPTPKLLILLRGVPGSGKSRLSSLIIGVADHGVHVSADDYFINQFGKYCFNPQNLGAAHEQARQKCLKSMESSVTPIVVDNTNTEAWEMLPYVKLALQYDYEIHIIEPSTTWKKNANILATKTLHGVPKQKISEMLRRFQTDLTVPKLVEMAQKDGNRSANINHSKQAIKLLKKTTFQSSAYGKSGDKPGPQTFMSGEPTHSRIEPERRNDSPALGAKAWNTSRPDNFLTSFHDVEGAYCLPHVSSESKLSLQKNDLSMFSSTDSSEFWLPARSSRTSELPHGNDKAEELPFGLSSLKLEGEGDESSSFNSRLAARFPEANEMHDHSANHIGLQLIEDAYSSGEPNWSSDSLDFPRPAERPLSLADIENDALHQRMLEDVDRLLFDDGAPESLTGSVETDDTPSSSSERVLSEFPAPSLVNDLNMMKNIFDSPEELRPSGVITDSRLDTDDASLPPKREGANILQNMFPSVPGDDLDDIFYRCNGDLSWCTGVLLDGGYRMDGNVSGPRRSGLSFNEKGAFTISPPPLIPSVVKAKRKKNGGRRSSSNEEEHPSSSVLTENQIRNPTPTTGLQFDMFRSSPLLDFSRPSSSRANGLKPGSPLFDPDCLGATALPPTNEVREDATEDLFVPIDGMDWFDMELPPDFVNQLMSMYTNPFGLLDANNLAKEDLKIRIPPKMAFKMFQYFFLNIMQKTNLAETNDRGSGDGEEEDNQKLIEDLIKMDSITSSTVPDFEKLMELEMRLSSRDQKYIDEKRKEIQTTMASKLTIGKFQTAFPTLKAEIIQDLYAQNNGKYEETLRALKTIYGSKFRPEGLTDDFLEASKIIKTSVQREVETIQESSPEVHSQAENKELTAQEWRGRATQHHFLRMEYRKRVQEMFNNGMGPEVSGYYTQLAKMHQDSMIESNRKAAQIIIEELNRKHGNANVVDLHHLYVVEALQVLHQYLRDRRDYLEKVKLRKLEIRVIVGKGLNSPGNARLAPAVVEFLRKNHFSFDIFPGVLVVTLQSRDQTRALKF